MMSDREKVIRLFNLFPNASRIFYHMLEEIDREVLEQKEADRIQRQNRYIAEYMAAEREAG